MFPWVAAMNGEGENMSTKANHSLSSIFQMINALLSFFLSVCLSLLFPIFPDINLIHRSKNIPCLKKIFALRYSFLLEYFV